MYAVYNQRPPFIPEDKVLSAWEQLRPLLPADLSSFATYFEYTWVGSCTPSLQLHHGINIAEGWHHGFNSMLSCNNPTIWKFLEALKKEHNLFRMQLGRIQQLEEPERRAAKWIRYVFRIQKLCDSFNRQKNVVNF